MALNPGDSFVDVGAGKAEFCVRLAARRGARCDAVERSSLMVAAARQRVEAAIIPPPGRVMVHETDATGFLGGVAAGYYAGAACVGSSHALSGLAGTIAALTRVVRRGGYVLIGEGFWNRQPTEEYLAATGIEAAEFQPLNGVTDAVSAAGVYLHARWPQSASGTTTSGPTQEGSSAGAQRTPGTPRRARYSNEAGPGVTRTSAGGAARWDSPFSPAGSDERASRQRWQSAARLLPAELLDLKALDVDITALGFSADDLAEWLPQDAVPAAVPRRANRSPTPARTDRGNPRNSRDLSRSGTAGRRRARTRAEGLEPPTF
jgi:SAM-dependent methyltransferase